MTLPELIAARLTAGANYVTALNDFRAALVELAALDQALCNQRVGYAVSLPTFGEFPDPIKMRHPVYAPTFGGRFADDVSARTEQIMAGFTSS
jgi:hypothetical protein